MSIRKAASPSLLSQPNVPLFEADRFEAIIFQKGYDVILEQAVACPCKGKTGSPKTSCQNCLGLGWVFLNPVETKAIISSINSQTKYKPWSPELTGTVSVTVRDSERFSFMDKVTFSGKTSILSEVKPVITSGDNVFIFASYKVQKINGIYLFNSDSTKLTKLSADKYSIKAENSSVISLNGVTLPTGFNGVISIDYEHLISYNVVDIPHDFRSSFMLNERGQNVEVNLPVQGVARRSHLITGYATNFAGNNLLDNSNL